MDRSSTESLMNIQLLSTDLSYCQFIKRNYLTLSNSLSTLCVTFTQRKKHIIFGNFSINPQQLAIFYQVLAKRHGYIMTFAPVVLASPFSTYLKTM